MKVNAVEVSAVSRHYRKKQVLREISFDVESGESVVIVGKNGCGKSTLLQIMAGAQKADSGSITYFGNKVGCGKSSRKYYGYVPQENPLFEELSVKDNLKFWGAGKKENLNSVMWLWQGNASHYKFIVKQTTKHLFDDAGCAMISRSQEKCNEGWKSYICM